MHHFLNPTNKMVQSLEVSWVVMLRGDEQVKGAETLAGFIGIEQGRTGVSTGHKMNERF